MRKVLIADSSSVTQFFMERILGRDGIKVFYVRHLRDLMVQVQEVMPDVLFLEAEIQGHMGKKVCEFLNHQPSTRHIPIILLTRIIDPHKHGMLDWPAVVGLLRKPLSTKSLLETISKIHFPHTDDWGDLFTRSAAG